MDIAKQRAFNERMSKLGKRPRYAKGGKVEGRKNFDTGGAATGALTGAATGAALGSIVPGIGTAVGAIGGALVGGLAGSGALSSQPQMPNIVDPVTGAQITDAQGNVVATQAQLQAFAATMNGQNGPQNQSAVLAQFQAIASGQGPNPAVAQLAQATGMNISQQAALMAGQRGASSNVGLIARQAAMQGAATQQQSIGQAATLQAQQSLGALGQEAGIAGSQVAEQQGALTASGQQALANQSNVLGAQGQYNASITGGTGSVNTSNTSTYGANLGAAATLAGSAAKGAGAATVAGNTPTTAPVPMGQAGGGVPASVGVPAMALGGEIMQGPHKSHVANFLAAAKGGKVPAMVSPGEVYLSPDKVKKVLDGADPYKLGEKIPGKAKVRGDSRKNDNVSRTLEDGGVVLPRHITRMRDPDQAALFVHRAVHMRKPRNAS